MQIYVLVLENIHWSVWCIWGKWGITSACSQKVLKIKRYSVYLYTYIYTLCTCIPIYVYIYTERQAGMQCGKSHKMLVIQVESVMGVLATFLCAWNLKYGTFKRKGENDGNLK